MLQKISEIIENIIFSLIFVLRKIWYFRQMREITKIWHLRGAFWRKCCFSCSVCSFVTKSNQASTRYDQTYSEVSAAGLPHVESPTEFSQAPLKQGFLTFHYRNSSLCCLPIFFFIKTLHTTSKQNTRFP